MRKTAMVVLGTVISIMLISLILTPVDVLGFRIHGPTPIPGYLFPHHSKHAGSYFNNTHNEMPNTR